MKGDDMKKIKLIFKGLGLKNKNQAYIKIFNSNCNLVYEGHTYNGQLDIRLDNNVYRLVANYNGNIIIVPFYVSSNTNNYIFSFNNYNLNSRDITFQLTDFYYTNLPIERGDIVLWQK